MQHNTDFGVEIYISVYNQLDVIDQIHFHGIYLWQKNNMAAKIQQMLSTNKGIWPKLFLFHTPEKPRIVGNFGFYFIFPPNKS